MKSIILQHWTGELNELAMLSMRNVQKYANLIGVPYQFIGGNQFDPDLSPPCQKLIMLDPKFDDYDIVAMFDMDMFFTNNYKGNIFQDTNGIGLHDHITDVIFKRCQGKHPTLTNKDYPYWGGCFWRLEKDIRVRFRKHINKKELLQFSGSFEDEGMMHRLATLAGFKETRYMESKWSQGSYFPEPEKANIIHIRPRESFTGPKIPKMEAYNRLLKQGVIE